MVANERNLSVYLGDLSDKQTKLVMGKVRMFGTNSQKIIKSFSKIPFSRASHRQSNLSHP